MPVATDAFQGNDEGVQRGRGGFYRRADDAPYVSDPSGATVKSGKRKGMPCRVLYGSPSNRGKQIENSTNLTKWGERRVVLGIGTDRALVDDCSRLVALDVDSDEYKTLADSIIIRAKDAAAANLAADRGTHWHALTEDHDSERDWVLRAEAGQVLGIPAEIQHQAVEAWATFLADNGLEVLAVEASCVDDTWRLAGTLDRVLRCTKPLRFRRVTGELVEIPAGTVVVGDVKTSNKRADRNGVVGYWQAYAIQIASYAQSLPYDTETETRGEWPWEIDQTHAVILRPNVVEVLAGEAERVEWELLHVDLVAGREHGGRCVVEAKAWEARKDIFSVAQVRDETSAPSTSPGDVEQVAAAVVVPEATTAAASPLRQAQIDRANAVALAEAKRRLRTIPEEGDMSTEHTFTILGNAFRRLPKAAQQWITHLSEEAEAAGVPFGSKVTKTARRYEILRALVHLAANEESDEHVREWLAIVDPRIAQLGSVPLGHILGSLSAAEAATFAGLATGTIPVAITDDGNPTPLTAA